MLVPANLLASTEKTKTNRIKATIRQEHKYTISPLHIKIVI